MKKILITSIITFIILISFLSTNVLAVTVTEDSLQNSITKVISSNTNLVKMDRTNDTITFTANNIVIKYNLSGNPKFTMNFEFNNQMTKEQCLKEHEYIVLLIDMFQLIADHFGCTEDGSLSYFVDKVEKGNTNVKKVMTVETLEFTNPISYAKSAFDNEVNFSDSLFTIKSKKISETAEVYKAQVVLEVNLNGDFSKVSEFDNAISDSILDAAQNAAKEYEEALKKETEQLNKYEALLNAQILVEDLKEELDVYKDSVQIDNKLYLKYSNTEKNNIYELMTSNAQKIFEKNANYFKKSNANYYDTGRLRTLPIIYYTDTYISKLELTSATENAATFDVIVKNIETGATYKKYTDGLKIVKVDGEWLIDSLKFKTKVEEDDTYPEFVVIEKEEPSQTDDKKEENKVTENIITEEINKIDNTNIQNNNVENINTGSNEIYISNQITDTTTTGKQSNNIFNVEYVLYLVITILTIALICIIYKIIKHNEAKKVFENEEEPKKSSSTVTLCIVAIVIVALLGVIVSYLLKLHTESSNSINSNLSNSVNTEKYIYSETEKKAIEQTIENYYKLLTAKENSPVLMLTDVMGLTVEVVQDPEYYAPKNYVEHPNPYKYVWTGIKYKEFAYELWYVSENILENKFPEFVKYKDYLYVEDNGNNSYDFKYEIIQNKMDESSTKDTCIYNVTVKNSKTGNTMNNKITMIRENSDFVISNVK